MNLTIAIILGLVAATVRIIGAIESARERRERLRDGAQGTPIPEDDASWVDDGVPRSES